MIVRKITPEEFKRTEEIFSIAFCYPYDCDKEPLELYKEKMANPEAREVAKTFHKYVAFEDDDKTMMCSMAVIHYPINFNQKEVVMAGIGDVSSIPAYRRRGGIRACFTHMLADLYKTGVTFSYLYPFSTCFYNKFGYGMGVKANVYELDLSRIPRYATTGRCILAEPHNAHALLKDVSSVYEVWQQKYNGMVINGPLEYQFVTKANPCKTQEFLYLYRSADGSPKGYISFHKEQQDGDQILVCTQIVFTDAEGLTGLLELAASYTANYRSIRFTIPEDIEIEMALGELAFGACKLEHSYTGMVRVINVEEALWLSSYCGDGNIALRITDPYIEANNGIFSVSYQDGKAVEIVHTPLESIEKTNATNITELTDNTNETITHTINMYIDRFSEFIFQNRSAAHFLYCQEKSLTEEDITILEKSFVRKPAFLMEHF
ncbi:MAG: GNAT family N-acetyltransferase [Lachnospiraceae bacterium]|nr:GNAT family N-acetyltransferase [Lachnospiraceae bacterium]